MRIEISSIVLLLAFTTSCLGETITGIPRVVDGDTIEIDGTDIRLHGIDTPEPAQPYGKDATKGLALLIRGREVICEGSERDDFDRLITVCRVGSLNLNEAMMVEGLAWAFTKYSFDYIGLEQAARADRRGIWIGNPERPEVFRARRWEDAKQTAPDGCPIKGNINDNGDKIYHVPWSPAYKRTRISDGKGERWFCDEGDALKAGWRAPHWR